MLKKLLGQFAVVESAGALSVVVESRDFHGNITGPCCRNQLDLMSDFKTKLCACEPDTLQASGVFLRAALCMRDHPPV